MTLFPNARHLKRLLAQGENEQQDFKLEISDSRKLARSISAFANTKGGRLLVGIRDNGTIAGARVSEEAYMVEAASRLYCRPVVPLEAYGYVADGKHILEIHIKEARRKPVLALDADGEARAYVRVADENVVASPVHHYIWQHDSEEQGALVHCSRREQRLLDVLRTDHPLALSSCCALARIRQDEACELLAHLIRFGVVESVYQGHHFRYRLKP